MSQQTWTPNPGVPGLADFGILTISGDPPISGGRGGGVKFSLLVIYIGRGFGGSCSDYKARRRISNALPRSRGWCPALSGRG